MAHLISQRDKERLPNKRRTLGSAVVDDAADFDPATRKKLESSGTLSCFWMSILPFGLRS